MKSTTILRQAMVDQMVREGKITKPWIEHAFRAVPRDLFLPDFPPDRVYKDEAIVTKWEKGKPISSSSQPSCMAEMLEKLDLGEGLRILEIGTGTGYNAALLALLVNAPPQIFSVDIDCDLA
ncbi:MAG: hypothetical protein HYU64_08195 [Armatimonadetes bacterium]|nr:hypothetical protein [Armatimonadota bacterium]